MRKLFIALAAAVTFTACENGSKNLGEPFVPKDPMTVDAVLEQVTALKELKGIQVEGVVEKSCMSEGCWFTIKAADGNEILFNIAEDKFKVPTNSPGKQVIVLADAVPDSTVEQKMSLSVSGMRFK